MGLASIDFVIKNVQYFADQISIEELDIIYKIPHCVPISAHHKWNFDDLLEKMWIYLQLVRM
jgi:ribosome-interacting GTPase 1